MMTGAIVLSLVTLVAAALPSTWLDSKPLSNWNTGTLVLPARPGAPDPELAAGGRCASTVRPPTSPEDRRLVARGWKLVGPYERYGRTVVISAMGGADGMCRPSLYQAFVFVNGAFAGTLSPKVMNAREDASISSLDVALYNSENFYTEFVRYTPDDALCCPSATTSVEYQIKTIGGSPRVVPVSATTQKNAQ